MKPMNIIAIDCGASFVKAALFRDSEIVKEIYKKTPIISKNIFLPTKIKILISLIKEILVDFTDELKEAFLVISNEMHGFILAKENGEPFSDYISWQVELGNKIIDGISSKQILCSEKYISDIKKTGMGVRAGLPSSNLLFFKRKGYIKKYAKKLYFYTLGDYIIRNISGKEVYSHITNAASTGLFNLENNIWNNNLIDLVSENNIIFPEIKAKEIICDFNGCCLHLLPAIGDQQAALLGADVKYVGDLSFNLGTGAQVSLVCNRPYYSDNYQIRPYFNGLFLKSIPHLPSGRAINVYIRFIKDILRKFSCIVEDKDIWETILRQQYKCIERQDIECDLSFFENPLTNKTTGAIFNISEYGLDFESLFFSIFKSMSKNFIYAADLLCYDKDIKRIVFSGGIAQKISMLRYSIIERYHNVDVVISPRNETLYGLKYYAEKQI